MTLLACSLTLSACASPVAPAANPVNFYDAVRDDVTGFWTGYFSSQLNRTYTPIAGMHLFTGQVSSACVGPSSDAFYCPADKIVYLDSAFMQHHLTAFGKFAPAMVIAHEMGHHVQNLLGLQFLFTIDQELQADCLAGMWFASANSRELLDVGDFEQAANEVFSLGDPNGYPWFAPDAHGSPQMREQAFNSGFVFGVSSCASY